MKRLSDRLLQTAAVSRSLLDQTSRKKLTGFVLSHQNRDGGFRGRDEKSDLYYTVFAVASLKALGHPVPAGKVWKYVRSFGVGEGLDLVHLVCLIQLRAAFPMFKKTRRKLFQQLEKHQDDSAYSVFLKLFADDFHQGEIGYDLADPTTNLAAALITSANADIAEVLMKRVVETGGFAPTKHIGVPDLLSTATALFALVESGVDLDGIHKPCLEYVESLWRDSGGFAGHIADEFEDVEYTFYALLSIGSLIKSMASDYGN